MDTTIFSTAPVPEAQPNSMLTLFAGSQRRSTHSNFALGAALTTLGASDFTNVLANACFGDAACQENRSLQTQVSLTNAQANLAATQVAAIQAQNSGKQTKVLIYVGIAFGVVVIVLGAFFLLKKS